MHRARATLVAVALCAPAIAVAGEGAAPDRTYLPELLAGARKKSLSEERAWLRLGHWRKRLLGG